MSIVVTTPTGNIGRNVAENLLLAGQTVTLIARSPEKVQSLVDKGARVVGGSHADARLLTEATRGAAALFVLTPPDFLTTDIRQSYRRFGEAAAQAIKANRIPYVVHLSSVGAELPEGTGPIVGLHLNEQLLAETGAHLVHLRAAYFMENTLSQIPSIIKAGSLFTAFSNQAKIPMIATRDIAKRAAELLRERNFTGVKVVELQGHSELSYEEVAAILSRVLERTIQYVTVDMAMFIESLVAMGASRTLAESFAELTEALEEKRLKFHEPRTMANSTPTDYETFAREIFRPAFEGALKSG